jgi:hypothetical protein
MRAGSLGIVGLLAAALHVGPVQAEDAVADRLTIEGPLNTIKDVQDAIKKCWVWPAAGDIKTGMDITILVSFRRNGEIFGGRVTYQSANVPQEERAVYMTALAATIRRCSPLPLSESLGNAIAGRPFTFHFIDIRKQRKA